MSLSALPRPGSLPDVLIVGGGIIGLSLALELDARGAQVTVLERDTAMLHASTAAAGMLAATDPHNPKELRELAEWSLACYPGFLARIEQLSGLSVSFQTDTTVQYYGDGTSVTLSEHSIDPRQLAAALVTAVRATAIRLLERTTVINVHDGVVETARENFAANSIVAATGAWSLAEHRVFPRKGQMLRVRIPTGLSLGKVHRDEHVYVVPRTVGPNAGTALIGATVEDAGFDTSTQTKDLAVLRDLAAKLVPELASEERAPQVEAWAGLRPATADLLPILGFDDPEDPKHLVATGHFRNGILLAPATAVVLADLIEGKQPPIKIAAFSPQRAALNIAAQTYR